MREKKFRGFDDIHCPQSWKEQVMDQAESSERKKSVYIWRIAVLFLLALLSLGTAYACSDTVRDWLLSLFSNGQEKVQVRKTLFLYKPSMESPIWMPTAAIM